MYALLAAPRGASYLGFEYNTDDHMVYAAWMRQAMDGRFLFDNRFTTDSQPGLTVHLYFLVLGWVAKITGIPFAANFARLFFTGLFVPLLYRLVRRVTDSVFATRLAITLVVLGGGIGFLVWHTFGVAITRPAPEVISNIMAGRLPIDVWQPEAFVFPSMLTNGLFMVSLCLIVTIFQCFLDAQHSWKQALWGAVWLGILMNIHSYDVLMIALAMVGFVAAQASSKSLTSTWLARGLLIAAGATPAALWFLHVLSSDPVFQSRAATPTFSANFRQVFFGYVLMMVLAYAGLWLRLKAVRQRIGLAISALTVMTLFMFASAAGDGYFLSPGAWTAVFVVTLAALALAASDDVALNLLLSWALIGVIALYFPALFQRKLAMGLSVPWAILAALGYAQIAKALDRNARNLATVLVILVLSATSIRWVFRAKNLIDGNVSNTTVHPVYLNTDEQRILAEIARDPQPRKVVLAMPGVPAPETDQAGDRLADAFASPAIPDLNPIVSGLTGAYTYAGHWSETPDYAARRTDVSRVFLSATDPQSRDAILSRSRADYLVAPSRETYGSQFADLGSLGKVAYAGNQFTLIRLAHKN